MNKGMMLFGFDLFAIVVALWKLITDLFPALNEKIKRVILAVMVAAAVVVIGLQVQGIILPPELEPTVNLILTTIMAFLVVMGYGEDFTGTIRAMVDLIKLSAVHLWLGVVVSRERAEKAATLLVKYRIK